MDQFSYGLDPDRANYNALYPTGECRWECFAQDIIRAIHIRVYGLSLSRDELSAHHPSTAILRMFADGFQVQERAFRGVALVLYDHLDPGQLGLVGQHVNEGGMGDSHEVLVVRSADLHILFPADIVSDDQSADPFAHHPIHDIAAGPMQVVFDLAVALVGQGAETG